MARKKIGNVQTKLRFPTALRQRLERVAVANGKSLNAEVMKRLEESFRREDEEARLSAAEKAGERAGARAAEVMLKSGQQREQTLQAIVKLLGRHFPELREELERETEFMRERGEDK
jgi:hypothetical protein